LSTTINPANLAEDVKEWTNVLGLSEAPSGTDSPVNGTTHQYWKDSCGYTVYETFSLAGVGHAVPFDGIAVAAYFGLDAVDGPDPQTAACPGAVPGNLGSAGGTGSGVDNMPSASPPPATNGTTGTDGTLDVLDPAQGVDVTNGSSPAAAAPAAASDVGAPPAPNLEGMAGPNSSGATPGSSALPAPTAGASPSAASCAQAHRAAGFDVGPGALLAAALGWAHRRRRRAR